MTTIRPRGQNFRAQNFHLKTDATPDTVVPAVSRLVASAFRLRKRFGGPP
jgi:hypothetical protein